MIEGSSVETLARVIRESMGLDPRRAAAVVAFARRLAESGQYDNNPDGLIRRVSKYSAAQIRARSLLIARTELLTAGNAGQQGLWVEGIKAGLIDKSVLAKTWIVTNDERLHFGCEKLGDESVEIDEVFSNGLQHPPDHPACLPSDSLVASGGRVSAVSERWYQGDVVVIRTASGKQLTCTPNHPILTGHGWLAADALYEGVQVVCSDSSELMQTRDRNDIYVPTRIQEVAHAYRVSPEVSARSVMASTEHFHGDATEGEIAVIWTNRALWNGGVSKADHRVMNDLLQDGHSPDSLQRLGFFDQRFRLGLASAIGRVRSSYEMVAFILRQLRPSALIALANSGSAFMAGRHLGLALVGAHGRPVLSGRSFSGLAGLVSGPNLDTVLDKNGSHSSVAYAVPGQDVLSRFTGPVLLDNIVRVDRKRFASHVYNLQTETEWYTANGIITHNCRCAVGLVKKTESRARSAGIQLEHPPDPFDMDAVQRMIQDAVSSGVKAVESTHGETVKALQAQLERIESMPRRRTVKSIKRDEHNRIQEITEREEDDS